MLDNYKKGDLKMPYGVYVDDPKARFSAAHFLFEHDKCSRIHGHNYNVDKTCIIQVPIPPLLKRSASALFLFIKNFFDIIF